MFLGAKTWNNVHGNLNCVLVYRVFSFDLFCLRLLVPKFSISIVQKNQLPTIEDLTSLISIRYSLHDSCSIFFSHTLPSEKTCSLLSSIYADFVASALLPKNS